METLLKSASGLLELPDLRSIPCKDEASIAVGCRVQKFAGIWVLDNVAIVLYWDDIPLLREVSSWYCESRGSRPLDAHCQ